MAAGVYVIINKENWRYYIGSAKDMSKRWNRHKLDLNRSIHINTHLQSAWNKSGADNFIFEVLEESEDYVALEQAYLDACFPFKPYCYNIANKAWAPRREISEETKLNLSKERKTKTISPTSRPVVVNGAWYDCAAGAARALGMYSATVLHRVKNRSGKFVNYRFADEPEQIPNPPKNARAVIVDGIEYQTIEYASKILKIKVSTLRARVESTSTNFLNYSYRDTPKITKELSSAVWRPLVIDGIEYKTKSEAGRALGVSGDTIKWRVLSDNYPNYQFLPQTERVTKDRVRDRSKEHERNREKRRAQALDNISKPANV